MKENLFKKHYRRFLFLDITILVLGLIFLIIGIAKDEGWIWALAVVYFTMLVLVFLFQVFTTNKTSYKKRRTMFTISSYIRLVISLYCVVGVVPSIIQSMLHHSVNSSTIVIQIIYIMTSLVIFVLNLIFLIKMRKDKLLLVGIKNGENAAVSKEEKELYLEQQALIQAEKEEIHKRKLEDKVKEKALEKTNSEEKKTSEKLEKNKAKEEKKNKQDNIEPAKIKRRTFAILSGITMVIVFPVLLSLVKNYVQISYSSVGGYARSIYDSLWQMFPILKYIFTVPAILFIILLFNKNPKAINALSIIQFMTASLVFALLYSISVLGFSVRVSMSSIGINYADTMLTVLTVVSIVFVVLNVVAFILSIIGLAKNKGKLNAAVSTIFGISFIVFVVEYAVSLFGIFSTSTYTLLLLNILVGILIIIFGFKCLHISVSEKELAAYQIYLEERKIKKEKAKESSEKKDTTELGLLNSELDKAVATQDFDSASAIKKQIEDYKNTHEIKIESYFDGNLFQLIGWNILCFLVNLITLSIMYPFTLCWKMRWKAKHTVYDGKRLVFDGNGVQLFGKWILWLFLSVITIGIYYLFVPICMEKWKAKHTHLVDDYK
ncbi:MAG: hypothetical protein WC123_06435 [Bacilli bacterium]